MKIKHNATLVIIKKGVTAVITAVKYYGGKFGGLRMRKQP